MSNYNTIILDGIKYERLQASRHTICEECIFIHGDRKCQEARGLLNCLGGWIFRKVKEPKSELVNSSDNLTIDKDIVTVEGIEYQWKSRMLNCSQCDFSEPGVVFAEAGTGCKRPILLKCPKDAYGFGGYSFYKELKKEVKPVESIHVIDGKCYKRVPNSENKGDCGGKKCAFNQTKEGCNLYRTINRVTSCIDRDGSYKPTYYHFELVAEKVEPKLENPLDKLSIGDIYGIYRLTCSKLTTRTEMVYNAAGSELIKRLDYLGGELDKYLKQQQDGKK